jgi:hypothetical protein
VLGRKSWRYEEGARGVWVVETCGRIDLNPPVDVGEKLTPQRRLNFDPSLLESVTESDFGMSLRRPCRSLREGGLAISGGLG